MQVDAIALHLRPRTMAEAVDLGTRLVQANARSVWASFAPVYAVVALLALATAGIAHWLPVTVLFCLMPWLDRTLLFVLSRAVFGVPTRLADVWAARRQVWWGDLPATLTLRRLSPWRSFTQPVGQLEGLRGAAASARVRQLLRGQRGAALAMQLAFAHAEMWLALGFTLLVVAFAPIETQGSTFRMMLFGDNSLALSILGDAGYLGVVLLVEPFFVGAGFVMYLNRRVELEAWDVEQEFRLAFAR